MEEFENEESLNLFQQYRRAVKLGSSTSRISNKDWYRSALELDVQIHCYLDEGTSGDCFLYISSKQYYQAIGRLDFEKLHERTVLEKWVGDLLKLEPIKKNKVKSLGFVFYLADNFSLSGLGPEYRNSAELANLRSLVKSDPREILEDKTVSEETHSWRIFPYSGVASKGEVATVVAVSKTWALLLANLREIGNQTNFPIRTTALSAPLSAVASVPWSASASGKGIVSIFVYHKFTLLAVFNKMSDLVMIRQIPHAQGGNVPRNLGATVFSSAMAHELEEPEVYLFSLSGADLSNVISSVQVSMSNADLFLVDPMDVLESRGISVPVPLELLTVTQQQDANVYPLAANATFTELREKRWSVQDFLPETEKELAQIPGAASMKFLRLSRILRMVGGLAFVGYLAFAGTSIWKALMSDVWLSKPEEVHAKNMFLNAKIAEYEQMDAMLQDRSKAWVNMELISQLVPANGSLLLETAKHSISKNSAGGIEKTWRIHGLASEKGIQYLENFETRDGKAIKELFKRVADITKNEAYDPNKLNRELSLKFSWKNASFSTKNKRQRFLKKGLKPHEYEFDLKIKELFQMTDPVSKTQ